MKAKELMIGDWVLYNEAHQQILEISGIDDEVYLETDELVHQSEIQPIPLTPEILEKNGFSADYRNDDLSYAQSCGDVIGIHINGKNGLMDEMYFDYVHQLQHALRLCGITREIIL